MDNQNKENNQKFAGNPLSAILARAGTFLLKLSGRTECKNGNSDKTAPNPLGTTPPTDAKQQDELDEKSSPVSTETLSAIIPENELSERWFQMLGDLVNDFDVDEGTDFVKGGQFTNLSTATKTTERLFEHIYSRLNQMSNRFNSISKTERTARVRSIVSDLQDPSRLGGSRKTNTLRQFTVSTTYRKLVAVCKTAKIRFYVAPSTMSFNPRDSQTKERHKLTLLLATLGRGHTWTVYGLPLGKRDLDYLLKALFRDLIILSAMDAIEQETGNNFEHVDNFNRVNEAHGFKDALSLESEPNKDLMRDLIFAQQNIVHKLLNQQEEIQADIARELHDSVLADILMLTRKLTPEDEEAQTKVDEDVREEILDVLENLTGSIREICRGLVPRDLKDWGLETVIQDLIDKVEERIEADCIFEVEGPIPDLPSNVQLHLFRIVQECLNNIEKYASAKSVSVSIVSDNNTLKLQIKDDGVGFDPEARSEKGRTEGGFGLPGIQERVELIRAYYPARLTVESKEGEGTSITLSLQVPSLE